MLLASVLASVTLLLFASFVSTAEPQVLYTPYHEFESNAVKMEVIGQGTSIKLRTIEEATTTLTTSLLVTKTVESFHTQYATITETETVRISTTLVRFTVAEVSQTRTITTTIVQTDILSDLAQILTPIAVATVVSLLIFRLPKKRERQ